MWQQYGPVLMQWLADGGTVLVLGASVGALAFLVGRKLVRHAPDEPLSPVPVMPPGQVSEPARDRRSCPRRIGQTSEVDLIDPEGLRETQTALILNRSPGGLGLKVFQPVPVDRVFHVRTRRAKPERNTCVPVEIRCCRRTVDGWSLNCRFAESLTWGELLLFE
jgi:hypothetical protein